MRLSCQQLRVLRSYMSSRVRTSGDIRGRGGRGYALPGHRGVCALSPSSPPPLPATEGKRGTEERWPRPGVPGLEPGRRGVTAASSSGSVPHPCPAWLHWLLTRRGGGRTEGPVRLRWWPPPTTTDQRATVAEGDGPTELVSVISADTHAQGPVLSRSVPGGGAWWGPLRKPCPPVLLECRLHAGRPTTNMIDK